MRRSLQRAVAGPALLAGAVLLAGCQAEAPETSEAPEDPEAQEAPGAPGAPEGPGDLDAEVVQYRRDAQRDVVQVKLTNAGAVPVRVSRVEVASPTFLSVAGADKDSRVGAGLSVDLTVPLADPACPAEADVGGGGGASGGGASGGGASGGGGAGHRVVLVVDGATVELPVDGTVLEQVRDQRCAEARVADLLTLSWQPDWADVGPVDGQPALRGRLVATPVDPSTSVGLGVEGATTLFTVERPVEATAGPQEAVVDVVVSVTRCDPHAVAEDKKGYLFPVRVRTDDGEVLVEVPVPVPEREALQELIDRSCR